MPFLSNQDIAAPRTKQSRYCHTTPTQIRKKFNDLLRTKAFKPLIRSKDFQFRSNPTPSPPPKNLEVNGNMGIMTFSEVINVDNARSTCPPFHSLEAINEWSLFFCTVSVWPEGRRDAVGPKSPVSRGFFQTKSAEYEKPRNSSCIAWDNTDCTGVRTGVTLVNSESKLLVSVALVI